MPLNLFNTKNELHLKKVFLGRILIRNILKSILIIERNFKKNLKIDKGSRAMEPKAVALHNS